MKNWQDFDYCWFLPNIAKLPARLGYALAYVRGLLYALLRRDWRMLSHLDADVDMRTRMAILQLAPLNRLKQVLIRLQRYASQSIEEYAAERMVISASRYQGFDTSLPKQAVFITAHYGVSIQGAQKIAQVYNGLLMTSSVVEKEQVAACVQQHYQRKYTCIPHAHIETGAKTFLRHLKQGGSIIIIADLPAEIAAESSCIETMMGDAHLAAGAKRLAQQAQVPIIAYTCVPNASGDWQYQFSQPSYPHKYLTDWYLPAYAWLTQQLFSKPKWWWAMDLLPLWYAKREEA